MLQVQPDALDSRRFESLLEDGKAARAAGRAEEAAEVLRAALALWRGPPLGEFAYEPFAEAEAARLDELRLRALEERIEADLALGRHDDLVGELERFVAEHPLRERPRGRLMLALYQSGRQAEALQAYQEGRRLLAEELGLEPGAALQQLEKQILTRDGALEPPPTMPLPQEERRRDVVESTSPRRPRRRLALALAPIALALVAWVAASVLITRDDARPAVTVVPDSLVKIDPKTHEVVDVFRVGGRPFKPAVVGDYVFVSSEDHETLSRIDVRSGEVDTLGSLPSPAGVAAGSDGTVWVGSFKGTTVRQLDADTFQLRRLIRFPKDAGPQHLTVGGGSVWSLTTTPLRSRASAKRPAASRPGRRTSPRMDSSTPSRSPSARGRPGRP